MLIKVRTSSVARKSGILWKLGEINHSMKHSGVSIFNKETACFINGLVEHKNEQWKYYPMLCVQKWEGFKKSICLMHVWRLWLVGDHKPGSGGHLSQYGGDRGTEGRAGKVSSPPGEISVVYREGACAPCGLEDIPLPHSSLSFSLIKACFQNRK